MNAPNEKLAKTNAALMARRSAALPRGVGQAHPLFAERADNAEIWDVEGRRWIDFCAGIAVVNTGHRHPKVMAAAHEQLDKFTHTCFQVMAYESYVALCERLNAAAPGNTPKKSFLVNSGAEAVENAVKIARASTGRSGVIAFGGGFHGRTMFGMALTGKVAPYKIKFGPFPGEIFHVPFPDALHGVSEDESIASIERVFKYSIEASRVAAILIEPVQGEGGYLPAPLGFLQRLRTLCDAHGILLIADEVQTGIARCGKLFATEHYGIEPDIITLAKGLGGGMTVSAVVGKAAVMDAADPGGLGSTYAGNPVAVASALAVLDVVEEEKLCERSMLIGEQMRARFASMQSRFTSMAEVRGLGAMTAVEFCRNGDPHQPAADIATALKDEAARRGLLLLMCGNYGNVLRVMVPLTLSDAVLKEGMDIIEASLEAIGA
ncbi:MAG TPA: 4-aminobutyrate--2-oxoglutarate transaminase [Denitromonas sp.]|uniref:4-aminobutyrate--2-oxoglutarate transaminase n=1 Tax=Denitromonas sp. TaxID=2734609 RepID=UPI001D65DC44|nr:4-aminobutyrate--2-oxoglutarate transaminase [Rhodocyclaceae bacterium]HPR05982.1 4-aminobutyrate--2-oxoglutarate transaminase [Denitromonas sp.]HQU87453.1 4-aminobutyrate--2-oxoglutarate transaminase [Denitromonas sp.]HQV15885.1 4-aminobutyrate--2-oxoglutarate transaminase [Denitromonas sp.]